MRWIGRLIKDRWEQIVTCASNIGHPRLHGFQNRANDGGFWLECCTGSEGELRVSNGMTLVIRGQQGCHARNAKIGGNVKKSELKSGHPDR